jgi:hypothetical protein
MSHINKLEKAVEGARRAWESRTDELSDARANVDALTADLATARSDIEGLLEQVERLRAAQFGPTVTDQRPTPRPSEVTAGVEALRVRIAAEDAEAAAADTTPAPGEQEDPAPCNLFTPPAGYLTNGGRCRRCGKDDTDHADTTPDTSSVPPSDPGEWASDHRETCDAVLVHGDCGEHVCKRQAGHLNPEHGDGRGTTWTESNSVPDTSRVTFGRRHEGTGMVLLQHADLSGETWGDRDHETVECHRHWATRPGFVGRAAHAALAEVREALNTAEVAGVDVRNSGVWCGTYSTHVTDASWDTVAARAQRHLAREVQALVDQGLRGDDLNARVPYEVRDHRAPVEADTANPGNEDTDPRIAVVREWRKQWDSYSLPDDQYAALLAQLDALRARQATGGAA